MLRQPIAIACLLWAVMSLAPTRSVAQSPSLVINLQNVQLDGGQVVVELFDDEASWLKQPLRKVLLSSTRTNQTASFDVPYGRYAISIYQDVNGDGELDRNFLGIPTEPIGFGNNHRPLGSPDFEKAAIEYRSDAMPQSIELYKVF